jgi:uncharacterized protein (TIGR03437 family)
VHFFKAILLLTAGATAALAQSNTFDSSGNGLLNGLYYFREVVWLVGDYSGNLSRAISLTGTITFDGNGNYSMTCTAADSGGTLKCPTAALPGGYRLSASGFGYMSNPLSGSADVWFGLVSQGVVLASTTENGSFNDLFVAVQAGSTPATNSTVTGSYWVASMDFTSGAYSSARDALFRLDADGAGNLAAINAAGYIGAGTAVVNQTINGARYSFSNGIGQLTLGGTTGGTNLVAGAKQMFTSPDGSFIFGGSASGYDLFFGVRTSTDNPGAPLGLYYQAGVIEDASGANAGNLQTFYGALNVGGGNILIGHQRHFSVFSDSYDQTYSDTFTENSDGSYSDTSGYTYRVATGGAAYVGIGAGPSPGITIAVRAPSFSGSGPYINPAGVVNTASYAPFTVGVSPGELITIYGTGLASTTAVDTSFPPSLGGTVVLINSRPARIYAVSPTQIYAVVPFATTESVAAIQVIANGATSNIVTVFAKNTTPGAFTNPANGAGYAAALHPDASPVTPQNPASAGETIAVFVTGLGRVTPPVADGTPGPSNPLSQTTALIYAFVGNQQATTTFSGLAPGLVGVYQLNITIPSGAGSGDAVLSISDADGISSQALLPLAPSNTAPSEQLVPERAHPGTARTAAPPGEKSSLSFLERAAKSLRPLQPRSSPSSPPARLGCEAGPFWRLQSPPQYAPEPVRPPRSGFAQSGPGRAHAQFLPW